MGNKVCIDGVWYILNKEAKKAKVTSSGNKDKKYQGEVVIPEIVEYEGVEYAVTMIEYCAFKDCDKLTSITIQESIISIGYDAFKGTAWYDNQPDGVVYVGKVLYKYKGLMPANSSIEIKDGTIGIGYHAFKGCSGLTSITIPESVTEIGGGAFDGCSGLISITIPESVTKIGGCTFRGCSGLTSITIPEGVTEIEGWAFYDCSGLVSMTVPESVKEIGSWAFAGCSGLTSIIVSENNPIYDSRNNCNAIIETKSNTLIAGCSTTIIPESVTKIEAAAFRSCSGLLSITIPENVTEIAGSAFCNCSGLSSIIVAVNNAIYDSRNNCSAIIESKSNTLIVGCATTIIPESVTKIGDWAFHGRSGLTSIIIPKSVTEIGRRWNAFSGCSGLKSIIVAENNAIYDSRNDCSAIIETNSNTLIAGCSTTIIPESVTKIGTWAFSGHSGLTSIIIPKSVTEIGWSAFWGCSNLTSVTIPESVAEIMDGTFRDCSALTSITIPESVTEIGIGVFRNCSELTTISIPESVTKIGRQTFHGCTNLKEIYCYNFSNWNSAFDESLVGETTLHVPKHKLGEDGFFKACNQCPKKSACVLNGFKKIVPIEAKVKKIELSTKIYLSEKSVRLLEQIITPSYATEQRLTWSSSNEEVAVVNSKGRVVALSSGTATITAMATDGSEVCASCEVVVRKMVDSIKLSNTSVELVVGNAFSLSAKVTPEDAYDTSFTWSTTDDDIAMILGNGRIVAVSAGKATITAKANDGSEVVATCDVTVTQNRSGNANSSC